MTNLYEWYMDQRNEEFDDNYLEECFLLMLKDDTSLVPYIKDFRITKDSYVGCYSNNSRIIFVNSEEIKRVRKMNPHLYGMEVIRHEMEHARNLKIVEDGKKDIESFVMNCSLRDYVLLHQSFYNIDQLDPFTLRYKIQENYETNPGERLAEIKAWKYLVNLLKNQRRTEDLLQARSMLYYSYVRGYQDNRYQLEDPTSQFLLNTGMYHDLYWLKKRIARNDYSFDTRVTYGLPITQKEYDTKILRKVKLQKRVL